MSISSQGQTLPPRYATLELFTNTPCPICGSQNPGLFNRLANYEGQYHLISFYPGRPYSSCVFYQANTAENTARLNFYPMVFGTPTVAINGLEFKSSNGVTNAVLDGVTGDESWLQVRVNETTGTNRNVTIELEDFVGGSLTMGKLFAVIVEREISYNAPNGETVHYNVFRKFLTNVNGDDIDLSSGLAMKSYQYAVDAAWQADETYVIAWLMDPDTKEIYNSGTRFDPDITSSIVDESKAIPLHIYPNPASTEINLTLPSPLDNVLVRFYDAKGRLIRAQTISGDPLMSIDVRNWHPGSYHAEILLQHNRFIGSFLLID
jgi:hypothetical protein